MENKQQIEIDVLIRLLKQLKILISNLNLGR